ncbi:MAG: hypothetical protein ABSC30_15210 [Acidimicrobiales bacterium]|jgi:hypothetical protein
MGGRAIKNPPVGTSVFDRLIRRAWPLGISVVYIILGLLYSFRWGSVVRHVPSLWITPGDLSDIFGASVALAHGHLGAIYQNRPTLREFPGILIALAPVGALSHAFHTTFVEIAKNHHLVSNPTFFESNTSTLWDGGTITSSAHIEYSVQPQWFVFVAPYVLALSCVALMALDALAERLQVPRTRRAVLSLTEAVALWPVIVIWGHPEDAVAVALTVYALILAMDRRWTGAGWLFGAAVAVQPLVVVVLPILLAMAGTKRALGLALRTFIPGVALTIPPLALDFHGAVHDLVTAPAYPDVVGNHQTPWTALSHRIGGRGTGTTIVGGPLRRLPTLAIAVALGWWARRLRDRPEMIVWAMAVALALRSYTELVMTSYYMWPALAVGLVVAARGSARRFGVAVVIAVLVTVVAQWHLGVFLWWGLDVGGITALLAVASRPQALEDTGPSVADQRGRAPARAQSGARPGAARQKARPGATTARTKSKSGRTTRR